MSAAGAQPPGRLGVVGAGTMGAGIAQLGVGAGMSTMLYDPVPDALEKGIERATGGMRKWAERGRAVNEALLEKAGALDDLSECELVIEAAPERTDLKRELFTALSLVAPDAVLASNTSSIPITSLASAASRPENVVGMHFFNPPPLMGLVEVIAADQTGAHALGVARATVEAMGKWVIDATDGPGFLVNRCGRPFYTEALRALQERQATHEQIDRICRLGGGYRMGPFELMDMVGIDVGFEVAKSFAELSFGEPRWKPNPIQARMVAAGRLGRKAGRGYYDYSEEPYRPEDPEQAEPGGGEGRRVVIAGDGPLAEALRERVTRAGFELGGADPWLTVGAGLGEDVPRTDIALCADRGLAGREAPVGFHATVPLGALIELTGEHREDAEELFRCLGFATEWVGDGPGLVLGRIACQLVNEAAFAIGEGVGTAEAVDAGLTLGLNHPRGPVEWGAAVGIDHVLAVIDGLFADRHEERYRAAPLLRRAASLGDWPPST